MQILKIMSAIRTLFENDGWKYSLAIRKGGKMRWTRARWASKEEQRALNEELLREKAVQSA